VSTWQWLAIGIGAAALVYVSFVADLVVVGRPPTP
jgi:hypothetical protein